MKIYFKFQFAYIYSSTGETDPNIYFLDISHKDILIHTTFQERVFTKGMIKKKRFKDTLK